MRGVWRSIGMAAVVAAGLALGSAPAEAQKRNRDVITREEIMASALSSKDIYQVIRSLRPHMVAPPRGTRSLTSGPPAPIAVYVDGNRQGELGSLQFLNAQDVMEVRYLDPSKAENEYGISHNGGALLIKLWRPVKSDSGGKP